MRDEEGESARELTQKEEEGKREENFSPFLSDFFYQVTWNERRQKSIRQDWAGRELGKGNCKDKASRQATFFSWGVSGTFFPPSSFDRLRLPWALSDLSPWLFFLVTGGHGGRKGGGIRFMDG